MKIPKQLRVGSKLYKVLRVRNIPRRFLRGLAEFQEKRIQIAKRSSSGRQFTQAEQEETFWHELTHAILEDMNHKLYSNEPFVERFSKRLTRAIRTARF